MRHVVRLQAVPFKVGVAVRAIAGLVIFCVVLLMC